MQFGTVAEIRCEWPSSCCRPSPFSVVRPAVPPSRKPRERMSPAAQREVADALEAEHRVEDVERDHRHAVRRVRRRRGDPVAHAAGLVDAFLQDLAVSCSPCRTSAGRASSRRVELALLVPDAELAEHALHAERARFVGHDRHDVLAERPCRAPASAGSARTPSSSRSRARRCSSGSARTPTARGTASGSTLRRRVRQVAAELHPPRAHVLELGRAFGERDVRHLLELVVGHRESGSGRGSCGSPRRPSSSAGA